MLCAEYNCPLPPENFNGKVSLCRVLRRSLEVRWNVGLYSQNIGSKIVDHVKAALYSGRPVFVLRSGEFSCRIKQFSG